MPRCSDLGALTSSCTFHLRIVPGELRRWRSILGAYLLAPMSLFRYRKCCKKLCFTQTQLVRHHFSHHKSML